ncbi:MAG: hypothetical protein HY909_05750 [Deltaproteobacteria bacterium]|nr:hypothetical protein [Deltaproteobacteria bacterium]
MVRLRALFALALVLGCGASYRFMYEGEAAFEHCYALDFDGEVRPSERQACWRAWLANYTYGAGTERIEYARRHADHATAPTGPAPQGLTPPGSGPGVAPSSRVPDPMNAGHAPPPLTEQVPEVVPPAAEGAGDPRTPPPSGATSVTAAAALQEPPGEACAHGCRGAWSQATTTCAAGSTTCIASAEDSYRDCMRTCY